MLNWKNTAENLLLILISVIAGAFIGSAITIASYKSVQPIIEKAIEKESTQIVNEIRKIKTQKGTTSVDVTSKIHQDTFKRKRKLKNIFKRK